MEMVELTRLGTNHFSDENFGRLDGNWGFVDTEDAGALAGCGAHHPRKLRERIRLQKGAQRLFVQALPPAQEAHQNALCIAQALMSYKPDIRSCTTTYAGNASNCFRIHESSEHALHNHNSAAQSLLYNHRSTKAIITNVRAPAMSHPWKTRLQTQDEF